jgi:hypothetical protein
MSDFKRINITLPKQGLERADEFARRERYTRSGLIAAALERFVVAEAISAKSAVAPIAAEASAPYGIALAPVPTGDLSLERVSELLRAFFSARDEVEAAWVFGSVARGVAGPMSDIDVAVLPKGRPDHDTRWALRLDLMSRLAGVVRREVDVAVLPDVSVLLGHRALVEGVRVFGEYSTDAAEAEIAAANAYWDYSAVRKMLADRLSERLGPHGKG